MHCFEEKKGKQLTNRFHAAVIYVFRTLTPAEERYFNIERELIGVAVHHGEASQLCVWRTSQRSNRSLTSRDELEEEFCHCQPETSTTSPEACQIRTSSGEQLQEGHTLKLSQPSQSKAVGLKQDECDSPHFNCPSNRQPTWTEAEWPPLLIQL